MSRLETIKRNTSSQNNRLSSNLSTPASPLPSTSVTSPTHEPSLDGISSMEQSIVPLEYSPLRDPPKIIAPLKKEYSQVVFHTQGLAVLYLRDYGFTLINGVVSYALDRGCPNKLLKYLHYLNVSTICITYHCSKQKFKKIQASWSFSSSFKWTPVMLLNQQELGECPFYNQTQCHRWIAEQGMCAILHLPINPIFHSCERLAMGSSTYILSEKYKSEICLDTFNQLPLINQHDGPY
ncbi:hypothetical protein TNCV_2854731 [Trichonephila clavipes]|nr:hypothetical protein TNCV_2854731 [Trichonephila clavipes]